MPASFVRLPGELRNKIYEVTLLRQEPIYVPCSNIFGLIPRNLTTGLLRVNKVVHREASSLFYNKNYFNLSHAGPKDVISFLEQIAHNATYIRHVMIDFPNFLCLDPGKSHSWSARDHY
ncbi:hypothetical protein F5Y09DRAFT_324522 [Xylaria sp. FL1042]|nr:hypothetical protein F5Y09DRAFT_324522 [Xylaria sp. FL1042]